MAYPPSVPPATRNDNTPQASNHASDHNTIANALNDMITEFGTDPGGAAGNLTARLAWCSFDGSVLTVNVPTGGTITLSYNAVGQFRVDSTGAHALTAMTAGALTTSGLLTSNAGHANSGAPITSTEPVQVTKNTSGRTWDLAQVLSQGDSGNGARVSMFNPTFGGMQLGVFGSTTLLYVLNHAGTTLGTVHLDAVCSEQFKHDIADAPDPLPYIEELRVRTFIRNDETHTRIGLVLEEVAPVLPELILDLPTGEQVLDEGSLLGLTVRAVQLLARRVVSLEAAA